MFRHLGNCIRVYGEVGFEEKTTILSTSMFGDPEGNSTWRRSFGIKIFWVTSLVMEG